MTVRWRILTFVLATLGFVALMIAVIAVTLRTADQFVQRLDGLHARFEVLAELDGRTSHYAAQVAKVLLRGDDQLGSLQAARVQMLRSLAELARVTRAEIATITDMAKIQVELPEIENTRRITGVYHTIDRAVSRSLALLREGRTAEATDVYAREAEFPLVNELSSLIGHELEDERAEVAAASAEIRRVQLNLLIAAAAVAAFAVACVVGLGALLYRSVVHPLNALTSAARAITVGKLEHQLEATGSDEFASLSRTFNDMVAALVQQRAAMISAGERLSAEVEARTTQLSEANASLRSVDSRRTQFLADVSHQLRTPLTILRGEAEVTLRARPDPEDQRQALRRIQDQAIEMGQLLEDLISFARSDAEGSQHSPEDVAVETVVQAAVNEGTALAEPREIVIETVLLDGGTRISADVRRLKQALIIGLDNAVKHSPPGASILVETVREEGEVSISIYDEGSGLAAEDQPRVFERFFRARPESELLNTGLGIGLAIARDIVERHSGGIALENRPAGGAVLRISLPISGEPVLMAGNP